MTLADELEHVGKQCLDFSTAHRDVVRRAVEALRAASDIIDDLPVCDENMHPAWCSAHGLKGCDMDARVAAFRALLDTRPSAAERSER